MKSNVLAVGSITGLIAGDGTFIASLVQKLVTVSWIGVNNLFNLAAGKELFMTNNLFK